VLTVLIGTSGTREARGGRPSGVRQEVDSMHSSLIGKIEKANRYARETDRISFSSLAVEFRGDNDTHCVTLEADRWQCNCHYFENSNTCAHILALQKVLGSMLPDSAQTSLFMPAGSPAPAEAAT
jgi:hypothetical protein